MTLKELINELNAVPKGMKKMQVKFNTAERGDLDFLSIYEVDDVIMIDIGGAGE